MSIIYLIFVSYFALYHFSYGTIVPVVIKAMIEWKVTKINVTTINKCHSHVENSPIHKIGKRNRKKRHPMCKEKEI